MKSIYVYVALFIILFTVSAVSAMALKPSKNKAITISSNGVTDYKIVTAKDSIASELTAAKELAEYLKQVTTATFEIINDLNRIISF